MARDIDLSKPLSEDDAAYVADRPWILEDARLRGIEITYEGDAPEDEDAEAQARQAEEDLETQRLAAAQEQIDNSDESEESEEDDTEEDDEEDDEVPGYDEWDYADLKAEAGNRGLSKSGSKEQLIERLTENDNENDGE